MVLNRVGVNRFHRGPLGLCGSGGVGDGEKTSPSPEWA